jgi:hypothetical protein
MFWKALVVSILAALGESWRAYRARRKEQGLPLRFNRRSGTYVVSDPAARIERYTRTAWNALLVAIMLWWVVVAYLLATQ